MQYTTASADNIQSGAGAGGSSSAHWLRKYASKAQIPLNITVFERNSYIGGRSTTVSLFNDTSFPPIELGASIFVGVNRVLQDAVKEFGLQLAEPYMKSAAAADKPFMGIYDGERLVVKMEDSGWWSSVKMLYRYWFAPVQVDRLMKDIMGKFMKIYEPPYFPFASLTTRVYDLELREACGVTGEQFLKEKGIRDDFASEVVQAMTRVNYGQNLALIHGLETMCSVATEGAVAVEGGIWKIFEGMVQASAADVLLATTVTAIERHDDGTFTVTSKDDSTTTESSEKFDTIILAAPYQYANLDITPKPRIVPDVIPYVNLHVTLFTSPHYLASSGFGLDPEEKVPRMLLTTLQSDEHPGANTSYQAKAGFNSISLLGSHFNHTTGGDQYLYKIFSMEEISDAFLARILGLDTARAEQDGLSNDDVSWVYRKLWQSYPYELPRVTFEELRLDENLWYTSGIESFISTMETSALMGKNIARLVVNEWISKQRSLTSWDEEGSPVALDELRQARLREQFEIVDAKEPELWRMAVEDASREGVEL
jgi:prenylcysteine oxidase/farnesylcysteine lyase